jgi:hypothetical protein
MLCTVLVCLKSEYRAPVTMAHSMSSDGRTRTRTRTSEPTRDEMAQKSVLRTVFNVSICSETLTGSDTDSASQSSKPDNPNSLTRPPTHNGNSTCLRFDIRPRDSGTRACQGSPLNLRKISLSIIWQRALNTQDAPLSSKYKNPLSPPLFILML